MPLSDWAFYVCVGVVFSIAAVRAFYSFLNQGTGDSAILFTMMAVISVFVIINHWSATSG
jgi:hypothetical protein